MGASMEEKMKPTSEIQNFFSGCCVFLTGATGFLGMVLLEKLLRSCTDIRKVLILVRKKRGKSTKERLDDILNNPLFDSLRLEDPKFADKVFVLPGDCSMPNMGLTKDAQQMIIEDVNCIFHCAATVRFDEKLQTAVYINVRATRDLLCLAKQIKYLKSFIYMSSAFSNCNRKEVSERFYEPTITGEQLIAIVDNMSNELLEQVTLTLIKGWPNTYAFTKSVAEEIVQSHGDGLPIAVVRPSIALATVEDPVPGWGKSLSGATGAIMGVASGFVRALPCSLSCIADIVPADYVANCTIAAAWDVGVKWKGRQVLHTKISNTADCSETKQDVAKVPIYNYVSCTEKPVSWGFVLSRARSCYRNLPSHGTAFNYISLSSSYRLIYSVLKFVLHTVPAYIVDMIRRCIGKELKFVAIYQKTDKLLDVLFYFSTRQWQFRNENTQALWKKLNAHDQRTFNFYLGNFDWNSYIYSFVQGTETYLLKKPLSLRQRIDKQQFIKTENRNGCRS